MIKNSEVAERLRQTAYFLWEHDGRPEGRAFDYWLRAKDKLLRQIAYDKWLAEGTPVDRADENWREATGEIGDK
ncbi:DUF2934 domain-containing protein [Devosia psychrophila]|jgi:hypothetical protein|uniref:DUF2934 domain-containing protein n=1 Tax=Devosia psychrophila TaxID=728005 RepID=A0A0F5PVW5_9HYPH|nr:DUF2934 domain-containing protein [Devosia psychrophila]KKC32832.1 hypothetical protein WH91_11785 [Devosia psychrophila]SFC37545.1 Protein of unknown function [Devosia psychrophila]